MKKLILIGLLALTSCMTESSNTSFTTCPCVVSRIISFESGIYMITIKAGEGRDADYFHFYTRIKHEIGDTIQ